MATAVALLIVGTVDLIASASPQHTTMLSVATTQVPTTTRVASGIPPAARFNRASQQGLSQNVRQAHLGYAQESSAPFAPEFPTEAPTFVGSITKAFWAVPVVMLVSWLISRQAPKRIAMAATTGTPVAEAAKDNYIFAALAEEVPKGTRKLVDVNGAQILIFWYRNELFAIENRSPAEGAFNQGFESARFTMDFGILCPSTESVFSLRDGSVKDWLPNNTVLRTLTPPCPPLEVFPCKIDGDEIKIEVFEGDRAYFDGGATSSFERNNVFGIEPRMYLEDGTYIDDEGTTKTKIDPATVTITIVAVATIAVAGTAICLYIESIPALAAFWAVGFGLTAKIVYDYTSGEEE